MDDAADEELTLGEWSIGYWTDAGMNEVSVIELTLGWMKYRLLNWRWDEWSIGYWTDFGMKSIGYWTDFGVDEAADVDLTLG